jgi:thioredoxin-related protein
MKTDLVAMQFFSDTNHVSLSTRKALGEVVKRGSRGLSLKVRDVDYDSEKELCRQYGVYGVPVTLVFCNDKLIGRHYGEITPEEFEAIFKHYSAVQSDFHEDPEK